MSYEFTNKIRRMQVKFSAKSVLRVLADYADERGRCFPSNELIAIETCLSDRTVVTAIEQLEQVGAIEVNRKTGRHNIYQLTPEKFTGKIAPVKDKPAKYVRDDARDEDQNPTISDNKLIDLGDEIPNEPLKDFNQCNIFTGERITLTPENSSPEPMKDFHPNHYITTNNHHSGGDACAYEKNDQLEFTPVDRKYMVPYFNLDFTSMDFCELGNRYHVDQHFQQQAQASFPDLNTSSIELIFSEYKRYWLDRLGYKQSPQKWMSHWVSRVESKHADYIQRQQRAQQTKQPIQPKNTYSNRQQQQVQILDNHDQFAQELLNQIDGFESHFDEVDVTPPKKIFQIEGVGHA